MAAEKDIVGDIIILGLGPILAHHPSHIDGAAVDQGEAVGSGDVLDPQQKTDIGVLDGDAVDSIVVGGQNIEERVVIGAVKPHFAVAGCLDHDGFVGRAAGGQVIGAVKGRAVSLDRFVKTAIDKAIVLIG